MRLFPQVSRMEECPFRTLSVFGELQTPVDAGANLFGDEVAQGGQLNVGLAVGALFVCSLNLGGDETFLMWRTCGATGDTSDRAQRRDRATVICRLHDVVLLAMPQAEDPELAGVAVVVRPRLEEQVLALPVDSGDED
ncbi:hypothetical protein [Streptomyces triticirhizae]|uniref:hypothetical protein n=1 Tax=Streptomyces triticirhizae TaxID=2483353 RepID=UPI001F42DF41|nr:hypothetical protein [Streptomyces triticirhizae]